MAEATGWKPHYILNGVNYQTLIMMLADAPRLSDKADTPDLSPEEEGDQIADIFASQL